MPQRKLTYTNVETECPHCGKPLLVLKQVKASLQLKVLLRLEEAKEALHITKLYELFPDCSYTQIRKALLKLKKDSYIRNPKRGWWSAK